MSSILMILMLALGLGPSLGTDAAGAQADDKHPVVVIDTSMGQITVELDAEKAPITTKNFLDYVDDKYYDGTLFHRVIREFMIQGGGFDEQWNPKQQGLRAPIKNESGNGLTNVRGAIAMARLDDPDSATSQFYISDVDNPRLDSLRYTAFGKVIGGMEVVDKIAAVATTTRPRGLKNSPVDPVVIKSIRRKSKS
jgi:peptidyl-prolyl cis-trans isomerase A (cyclophilin A)